MVKQRIDQIDTNTNGYGDSDDFWMSGEPGRELETVARRAADGIGSAATNEVVGGALVTNGYAYDAKGETRSLTAQEPTSAADAEAFDPNTGTYDF